MERTPCPPKPAIFAPKLLTYIMATRFLTDFIDGDNYYKVRHPLHNLQRTRAQIALLRSMEAQYGDMVRIITSLAASASTGSTSHTRPAKPGLTPLNHT